eukprot:gnl/TRDRNA2_/TRDRNA2_85981_c0_seq1.p1 gnl/TRDRNA2_/TRDRNA2_85981_c0~~gnl/TRDRNA2_/TRDRNA2_85981_c0_seq1.p1  ORF type:complete len:333 (-),score=40.30 gnl/TRDRNA2_/TRDRNA2_85981_c0_seq1:13-1011(-)
MSLYGTGMGPCMSKFTAMMMTLLFFGMWWSYNVTCGPSIAGRIIFNVVLFLAYTSYLQTLLTDPGTPSSPEWRAWLARQKHGGPFGEVTKLDDENDGPTAGLHNRWAPGELSMCKKCNIIRPERSHHCSATGCCVLRMDHYCPWVGNCVGFRNHKYFLLFLWWAACACVAFLVTLDKPTSMNSFRAFLIENGDNIDIDYNWPVLSVFSMLLSSRHTGPLVAVTAAVVFLLVTGGMTAFTLGLAFRNCTTIEDVFEHENPYSHPSSLDNLRELVGPLDWRLLLPIPHPDRPNGTDFVLPGKDDSNWQSAASSEVDVAEPGALLRPSGPGYGSV